MREPAMVAYTRGRLLVATPVLTDPNFDRTVVVMLEHSADGAIGVVLTRPSDIRVLDVVPELAALIDPDSPVYLGGPVAPEAAIALAQCEPGTVGFKEVGAGIGTLDLPRPASDSHPSGGVRRCRLFSGYSGWGPGQLEAEIDAGAWFVVEMLTDDLFVPREVELWGDVLRRQPDELSWFANFPEDIAAN